MSAPIVIIGAGPCGIGAAWTLHHRYADQPYLLIDQSEKPGGNARSSQTPEGFTFDCGGHVLYPHKNFAEFGSFIDGLIKDWDASCPVRGVYTRNRLIPAPVQRNIHRLPWHDFLPILGELISRRLKTAVGSGADTRDAIRDDLGCYLKQTFGHQLTRRVMAPLNEKMWTISPSEMSSIWVREKSGSNLANVPTIELGRLLCRAVTGRSDPGWQRDSRVSYPRVGGTGAIWEAALNRLPLDNVQLGVSITSIDADRKTVFCSDGSSQRYSALISSIPLDCLLRLCASTGPSAQEAHLLKRSQAIMFGFGIDTGLPRRFRNVHTFQTPDCDVPFWRVTIPSNVSAGNVPRPGSQYSVLCEISRPDSAPIDLPALRRQTINGLQSIGLLMSEQDVCSSHQELLHHGYPLPFLGREETLSSIHQQLAPYSIYSRGRFGGWRYEVSNQDHAFMQGVEVVQWLRGGVSESVYKP